MNNQKLAYVRTYGCQQNFADSEKIRGMLSEMGYGMTDGAENADLILFNTCAVRENAENRVFGNVGALKKLKREKPNLIIGVCGCMVQQKKAAEALREKFPFVDLIFGTHAINDLPELLGNILAGGKKEFYIPEKETEIKEGVPVLRDSKFKAGVSIMYGCDNFCTYCVVPYVRGRERSRNAEDIIAEVRGLINEGCKDILLLGQNVNSYGKGGNGGNNETFGGLLKRLDALPGKARIGFMTSHPKDISREVIDIIAASEKISRHLHLPVQSGSDRILRLMNRKYTRNEYLEKVNYARLKIPGVSITTDIIVGFPGETEEDFKETMSLLREARFDSAYTFLYSKREGTKAAEMTDNLTDAEKGRRFTELLTLQGEIGEAAYQRFAGETLEVLCEGVGRTDETLLTGKSRQNIIVDFPGDDTLIGEFVRVKIEKALKWALIGKIV